jgi:hypothetical protein
MLLHILLSPIRQPVAIARFSAQYTSEFTLLADIGFYHDAKLILAGELVTSSLLKNGMGNNLKVTCTLYWLLHL